MMMIGIRIRAATPNMPLVRREMGGYSTVTLRHQWGSPCIALFHSKCEPELS